MNAIIRRVLLFSLFCSVAATLSAADITVTVTRPAGGYIKMCTTSGCPVICGALNTGKDQCVVSVPHGTSHRFTAVASGTNKWVWGGACSGAGSNVDCVITPTSNVTVSAHFGSSSTF